MSYCELGLGGWVGGWVGEKTYPDSNQQSNTSSTRLRGGKEGPRWLGMVMWSTLSRWRSVMPWTPLSSSSWAMEEMAICCMRRWVGGWVGGWVEEEEAV